MQKYIVFTLICTFHLQFAAFSQEIEVEGGFLQEEIRIGEPVRYYLKAKYPARRQILFPGEDYDFAPFEFVEKEYFPSAYDSTFVLDSAVYTLTSFEIDPYQALQLPVFWINDGDSVALNPSADSLKFVEVAPAPGDSLALKTDLTFLDVPLKFNYPYLLIGIGIIVAVLLIVALVFGKKMVNAYRIRRVRKNYQSFSEKYDELVHLTGKSGKKQHLENTVALWKNYLEKLEKIPYTKLTTREMITVKSDKRLDNELKVIDRNLYGHQRSEDLKKRLMTIKSLAKEYQENKIAEIKNG